MAKLKQKKKTGPVRQEITVYFGDLIDAELERICTTFGTKQKDFVSQPQYTLSNMIKTQMDRNPRLKQLLGLGYVIEKAAVAWIAPDERSEENSADVGITFTLVDPERAKDQLDEELKELAAKAAPLGYEVILKRMP